MQRCCCSFWLLVAALVVVGYTLLEGKGNGLGGGRDAGAAHGVTESRSVWSARSGHPIGTGARRGRRRHVVI